MTIDTNSKKPGTERASFQGAASKEASLDPGQFDCLVKSIQAAKSMSHSPITNIESSKMTGFLRNGAGYFSLDLKQALNIDLGMNFLIGEAEVKALSSFRQSTKVYILNSDDRDFIEITDHSKTLHLQKSLRKSQGFQMPDSSKMKQVGVPVTVKEFKVFRSDLAQSHQSFVILYLFNGQLLALRIPGQGPVVLDPAAYEECVGKSDRIFKSHALGLVPGEETTLAVLSGYERYWVQATSEIAMGVKLEILEAFSASERDVTYNQKGERNG
jgi:hypothetical protein